jgi:hypothetical protein
MSARFEYKFVRLEQDVTMLGRTPTPSVAARETYQESVHQHAAEGWRLVQVFAPGLSAHGSASYFELIFERPVT